MHTEQIAAQIQDYDERQAFENMANKPFPKLSGSFQPGVRCDRLQNELPGRLSWVANGYAEQIVPVRTLNFSVANSHPPEVMQGALEQGYAEYEQMSRDDFAKATDAVNELLTLGVPAFITYNHVVGRPHAYSEALIHCPRVKLEATHDSPQSAREVPDFESAVTFLAFLLHKGYVTAKDVPQIDVGYQQQELSTPFDRTMLKFAQSAKYQDKIREGLRETSLQKQPERSATQIDDHLRQAR